MNTSFPASVSKDCRIRIGLTEMLPEFLDLCTQSGCANFFLAAPFVDDSIIEEISAGFAREKITLRVVVGDEDLAKRLDRRLPRWPVPLARIFICARLHAKVYLAETRSHGFVGLIASQNPTRAGMTSNVEAGVLICAENGTREWWMLADLRAGLLERSRPCLCGA